MNNGYFCTKCDREHRHSSRVGKAHALFCSSLAPRDARHAIGDIVAVRYCDSDLGTYVIEGFTPDGSYRGVLVRNGEKLKSARGHYRRAIFTENDNTEIREVA